MNEYWLISIPNVKSVQETFDAMNNVTNKHHHLSENFIFTIPELKVGTLDQLVGLSDELGRLDTFVEQVTRKAASYLHEVCEEQKDKSLEQLEVNNSSLTAYLTSFQWDSAKYPTKQSLRQIADIIAQQIGAIESELKSKATAYNNLKGNLLTLEKKQSGSLLTRNIGDLIHKDQVVQDSEYLTTLIVIVPKHMFNDWYSKYERLSDMVVPQSSVLIAQDNDHGMFTVTLFKKVVDEFKLHARENRFVVRDFTYNDVEVENGRNEIMRLAADKKKQFGPLLRWLKVNFSECFSAWVHVKSLRVFVESVLRYGLPVNFVTILVCPYKKNTKKLRDLLNNMYSHLDGGGAYHGSNSNIENVEIPGINFGQNEYYPYVYYKIGVDMIEQK